MLGPFPNVPKVKDPNFAYVSQDALPKGITNHVYTILGYRVLIKRSATIYGSQPLLLGEGVLIRRDATIYGSKPLLLRMGS